MPELPEVQTIVSDLNKKIKGDKITAFWSDWSKAIKNKSLKNFQREIKGRKILGVRRRGKNIFIDLSGEKTLYIHLKMTGHLLVKPPAGKVSSKPDPFQEKVNQYIHHSWRLEDKKGKIKNMDFSDLRKFAKIVLIETRQLEKLPEINKLGPDALDKKLTFKKFEEILKKKKEKAVGWVIMEQELIAGIGNIYRSEILFAAGISPQKKVKKLKKEEKKKLFLALKKILSKAVRMRGTSDSDYRDTAGNPGSFQKALKVYKKNGKKCQTCGIIITREKIGQRGVFFCPQCQK